MPGNLPFAKRLMLQRIDLASGRIVRKFFSGTGHAHSINFDAQHRRGWLFTENGQYGYEFDADSLQIRQRIPSPGFMIGGHGTQSPDGSLLYFPDRGLCDGTLESNLNIYDIARKKILGRIPRVGVFPHDIILIPDTSLALVACYGVPSIFAGGSGRFTFSKKTRQRPAVTVVDVKRGKIVRRIPFPPELIVVHLAINKAADQVFVEATATRPGHVESEVSHYIKQRNVPLSHEEIYIKKIFLPGKIFKINLSDFSIQAMENDHHFCRAQSIVYSPRHRKIYETFGSTHTVISVNETPFAIDKLLSNSPADICEPRGAAITHDENYLVISGRENNLHFINLNSGLIEKDKTLLTVNGRNSHITIQ